MGPSPGSGRRRRARRAAPSSPRAAAPGSAPATAPARGSKPSRARSPEPFTSTARSSPVPEGSVSGREQPGERRKTVGSSTPIASRPVAVEDALRAPDPQLARRRDGPAASRSRGRAAAPPRRARGGRWPRARAGTSWCPGVPRDPRERWWSARRARIAGRAACGAARARSRRRARPRGSRPAGRRRRAPGAATARVELASIRQYRGSTLDSPRGRSPYCATGMSSLRRYAAAISHLGPRQTVLNVVCRARRRTRRFGRYRRAGRGLEWTGRAVASFLPHDGGTRLGGGSLHGDRAHSRDRGPSPLGRGGPAALALQPPLLRLAGRAPRERPGTPGPRLDRAPPTHAARCRLVALPLEPPPAALDPRALPRSVRRRAGALPASRLDRGAGRVPDRHARGPPAREPPPGERADAEAAGRLLPRTRRLPLGAAGRRGARRRARRAVPPGRRPRRALPHVPRASPPRPPRPRQRAARERRAAGAHPGAAAGSPPLPGRPAPPGRRDRPRSTTRPSRSRRRRARSWTTLDDSASKCRRSDRAPSRTRATTSGGAGETPCSWTPDRSGPITSPPTATETSSPGS